MTRRPYTGRCPSTYLEYRCVVNWTDQPHTHRWWNDKGHHLEWVDMPTPDLPTIEVERLDSNPAGKVT